MRLQVLSRSATKRSTRAFTRSRVQSLSWRSWKADKIPSSFWWSVLGVSGVTAVGGLAWLQVGGPGPSGDGSSISPVDTRDKSDVQEEKGFPQNILALVAGDSEDQTAGDVLIPDETQRNNTSFTESGLSYLRSALPIDTVTSLTASWAWPSSLTALQSKVSTLMLEWSLGPGSLYDEIVNAPPDEVLHPECGWDARVRLGDELCLPERAYLRQRRRTIRGAFAKLIGVDESEIELDDIPVVAFACSGGGYRAMCNTAGSLLGAKNSGLLDVTTYISGISGSCWALAVLYSGVCGDEPSIPEIMVHLRDRISTSYFDTSTLDLLTTPPTNKYLLSGLMRKASAPGTEVSLVDLYGTLLSSRIFLPSDLEAHPLDERHLSLHRFRRLLDGSSPALPLPILTCVRHEIPLPAEQPLKEVRAEKEAAVDEEMQRRLGEVETAIENVASWLWFEWTPYEVGCDELGAWIPTWSFGRRFDRGKNLERLPELSLTILSGIVSSAFCSTLEDYFREIQPLLRTLPTPLYNWIAGIVNNGERDPSLIHPVLPNELPNFVKGLEGLLREGSPKGICDRDTLGFLDAGALLNVPYYPLLRRNVDCIIAIDASVEFQDLHFQRAEELALKRGLKTWPRGARWPIDVTEGSDAGPVSSVPASDSEEDANETFAKIQEKELASQAEKQGDSENKGMPMAASRSTIAPSPTGAVSTSAPLAAQPTPAPGSTPVDEANRRLASAQETELAGQAARQGETEDKRMPYDARSSSKIQVSTSSSETATGTNAVSPPVTGCTVWIGSSTDDPSPSTARFEDLDEEALSARDGIGVVYIPQLQNPAVPDFNPLDVSTFRFELAPEESEKLFRVGQANFEAGRDKIVKLLRVMWLRKRRARMEKLAGTL